MAPPAAEVDTVSSESLPIRTKLGTKPITSTFPTPLKYSGSLDGYEHFDVTSVIGREFPKLQLSQIIEDDTKIRDLAITGRRVHFPIKNLSLIADLNQSHNVESCFSGIRVSQTRV
jgi:hypothetical protein